MFRVVGTESSELAKKPSKIAVEAEEKGKEEVSREYMQTTTGQPSGGEKVPRSEDGGKKKEHKTQHIEVGSNKYGLVGGGRREKNGKI